MSAMAAWAVYCVLVAALLSAAAWAGESALRRLGRPGRWAWLGALAGSLVVPAAVYWLPTLWQRPGPGVPDAMIVSLPGLAVTAPPSGWSTGRVLLVAWLVASALVVAYAVFSLVRLALARRGWRCAEVEGVAVYVSGDVGPAVFAAGRTSIVVPEWALELDDGFRRLMLLHEAEHARAGDPVLLLFALGLVAAMPWNPLLWWQLRRLRMAVEVDCDARVVAATGDARLYGSLLIEVGRRRSGARLVVAFSEPRSFLERRIRAIVSGVRGRGVRRALAPALVGAVALFAAVCARDPASPGNPMDAVIAERWEPGQDISSAPVFTPMTVPPRILNQREVEESLSRNYPPLLKEAGIGGTTTVWLFVDEQGRTQKMQINQSSGQRALDDAALRVASGIDVSAALNGDRPVPVWISVPITFTTDGSAAQRTRAPDDVSIERLPTGEAVKVLRERGDRPGEASDTPPARLPRKQSLEELAKAPAFTPMTVPPRITNQKEVEAALSGNYPPLLRDAGIGGTATVWFFVDETGRVVKTQLNQSSGYDALDAAALRVAGTIEVTPALNREQRVPVWVSIPITFTAR